MLPLFPVAWIVGYLTRPFDPLRDRLRVFVATWVSAYGHASPLYHFVIDGRDLLPHNGPYVLVANHESGLDVLALLMLRTRARFLAESWLFRIPLVGRVLLRACRHIPVEPGSRESGHSALATAEQALAEGTPVAIFPEGNISPDSMARFRRGAFVLAQRGEVPIVPVLIEGAAAAWQPGALVVHGQHTVRITVQPPIPFEAFRDTPVDELAERIRGGLLEARHSA